MISLHQHQQRVSKKRSSQSSTVMPTTSKRKQDEQNDDHHHHHLQQRVVSKKKKRERPDDIEDYMASSSTGSKRRKKDEQSSPFDLDNVIKSDTDDTNLLSESQSSSYGEIDSDSSVTKTMIEEEYHRYSDSDENQQQQQRISNNNKGKQFGRGCVSIRTKKKESRKRQRKKLDDSEEDSINGGFDDGQQYSDEQRERALVLATPSSSSSSRGRSMITVPNIFEDNGNLQYFLNRGRQRNSDGDDDDDENNNNLNNFDDDDDDSGSQCEEDHNLNDGDDDDGGSSGNRGEEELWKRTTSPFLTEVEKTLGPLIEGEECPGCIYVNPTDHRCEKNWAEFNKIYITETPWRDPKEVAIQQYNFYENRLRVKNKKLPKWSPRMIFEHNWKHVTDDAIFNMQCKIRFQNIMREFLDQGSYITNGKMVAFDGSKEVLSTLKTLDDLYQRRCKLANKDAMQNGVSVKTVIHQDGIKNTSSFL